MSPTMCRPKPFKAWFVASFQHPFQPVNDWKTGPTLLDFGKLKEPLLMKVAISFTGAGGARANLAAELPHWDFDRIRRESDEDWNAWLGRILVEGGSDAEKTKFYRHLFSHLGQPWRSQYWVRKVHAAAFSDTTPFGGYNGDEDQGQMGALSALMAIGLFDMDGGASRQPRFDLTAPLFDKITIRLHPDYHPGGSFVISTRNNRPDNVYIQSARLNGKAWNSFQVPHESFVRGGTLELELGPQPNKVWGTPAAANR
jgi:putative alpha-1,2-mannosidase